MIPIKFAQPNVLETLMAGDTWRGFTIQGTLDADPNEQLHPVQSAKLQFRHVKTRRLVYELNSATGSAAGQPTGWPNNTEGNITIEDATNWRISVDSQDLPMGPGVYLWELEVLDALNINRTLLRGKMTICQDISQQ